MTNLSLERLVRMLNEDQMMMIRNISDRLYSDGIDLTPAPERHVS
jgi:hypothetical protein